MSDLKTERTMCPMNCHPTLCGMLVKTENNKLIEITGDKDNPDSQGFLCIRGKTAHEIIDNPNRILHPCIRTDRNTNNWEQISWDEAVMHISEKLAELEPSEFGIWLGHGDGATNYGTRLGGQLSKRFAYLFGCQWWHPAMICWGLAGLGFGLTGVLNVHTKENMSANSDLIILWGANITSQPNTATHIKKARQRGAKIITIDVRQSEACSLADESVYIKPGTDAALALAMIHIIIRDRLIDEAFIDDCTIGYQALVTHIQSYTPEWAAEETGIDVEKIELISQQYTSTEKAMILVGGSSMHKSKNGWQAARAIACLPALTGKLGKSGAGLGPRHGASCSGQELNLLLPESGNTCTNVISNQMSAMVDAFINDKIKALFLSGTDMLSSFADVNQLKQGLDKVELIVCHDLFSNDTIRECADIVLPATAWLEQLGCKSTNTHLYLMEKILPAPDETKTLSEILQALANKLNINSFFPWDSDEGFIDQILNHESTNNTTIEKLRKEGGIKALNISHVAYPDHSYSTPSKKIEFFSQTAIDVGLPGLPVYEKNEEDESFPLKFRQGRTIKHFHGFYDHGNALPGLKKRMGKPELWLSPTDASSRNISQGDSIRIHNQRGEFMAYAFVTEKISAGTVWMRDGWSGLNNLTSHINAIPDSAVDLFSFSAGQSTFAANVEVERVI
ncbi:MAG: molybdopterin-dependent oxidoreductase [Pseudomonadota bacterium]